MKRLLPILFGFALLLLSSTEGWSLPPCMGSPASFFMHWNDCFGTVVNTWSGRKIYVGEFKNGAWHGHGTNYSAKGKKYVGEFKDHQRHGRGTIFHSDGTVTEGIWENNKFLYAKKLSPTVTAKKSPEPSKQIQKENERLRREIARLKKEKKQRLS